jgi:hypothetical protein
MASTDHTLGDELDVAVLVGEREVRHRRGDGGAAVQSHPEQDPAVEGFLLGDAAAADDLPSFVSSSGGFGVMWRWKRTA